MLRRWFGAWVGGKAKPAAAPGTAVASAAKAARIWHDEIAHGALPYLLLTEAEHVLAGETPVQGRLDLLYDVFEDIGRRRGLTFDQAMDEAEQALFVRRALGAGRVAVVIMPPPHSAGEAYFVGLSVPPGQEPRCLALDRAPAGTLLVALDAEGGRNVIGPGPAPDLESFIAALAPR